MIPTLLISLGFVALALAGLPVLVLALLLLFILTTLLSILISLLRRRWNAVRLKLLKGGCYLLTAFACGGIAGYYDEVARQQRQSLLTSIESFHQHHQRYPDRLEELIPSYQPQVPVAVATWIFPRKFSYRPQRDGQSFLLQYMSGWLVVHGYTPDEGVWTIRD